MLQRPDVPEVQADPMTATVETIAREAGYDVRRVQQGEITPWGWARPFADGEAMDGRWACASHALASFDTIGAFHAHLADEGRHDIVWRCLSCGVPHGFRVPA